MGDVRRRDEQHASDSAHEHEQRGSNIADDLLVERNDDGAAAGIRIGKLRRELPCDSVEVGGC